MTILFFTPADPREQPLLWSGTALSILRGMEAHGHRVHVVIVQSPWATAYTALKWRWYRGVRKQIYFRDIDPVNLHFLRRTVRRAIRGVTFDAVFAWLPWMTLLVDSPKPRLFWYDTTYAQTQPLYFPNVCAESHAQSLRLDRQTVRAATAVYSSDWSRDSAVRDLSADPARVFAVPFGANLSDIPTAADVENAITDRVLRQATAIDPVRLLFVGMDWARKGGPIALQALRRLHAAGEPATLTIVGTRPDIPLDLQPHVICLGKLDKQNPEQRAALTREYLTADWFVMASAADSYGIVYCEAMAHGLPSLATRTGAVAELIVDGQTGALFEPSPSVPQQIADTVIAYCRDPGRYQALCRSSRRRYDTRLNWQTASAAFDDILLRAVHDAPQAT